MTLSRVSLDQWRTFVTVVDAGSYARAAEQLHRSQSSLSYAINKLQTQLGVEVFTVEGRKSRLTPAGTALLRHARQLLKDAEELQSLAGHLKRGWEPEVRLVVDVIFPNALLLKALQDFVPIAGSSRVQLHEVVLSGADEALLAGQADLAIAAFVPPGFLGEKLIELEFVAVAATGHPLHRLKRSLALKDLARERQLVVRDSGISMKRDTGWLGAEQRWTVTQMATSIELVRGGMGFAWLPRHMIEAYLANGELKPLPLQRGGTRMAALHLIVAKPDEAGPAACELARILRGVVESAGATRPAPKASPGSRSGGAGSALRLGRRRPRA